MIALLTAVVRLLFFLVRLLPVRLAGALGAGLGRIAYYLDRRHRRVACRNLARIYAEQPRTWRRRIARESFAELGRTIFELPHVFLRSKDFLQGCIHIEGEEDLCRAMAEGHGAFLVGCHHSNWELGSMLFSMRGFEIAQSYRPLRQPALDHYLKRCRQRFGARLFERSPNPRWLLQMLKRGGAVAIMIDQHMSKGLPVPFLGHLAATTTLPAVLASKYRVPIFAVALHRIGRGFRFRMHIWRVDLPSLTGNKDTDIFRLMRQINHGFDAVIRQRPELWLWTHRRWRLLEQDPLMREVVHGTP